MGGTMRLGGLKIILEENTRLFKAYQKKEIVERFRHRYHINSKYFTDETIEKGLIISSKDETGRIINSIELNRKDHFMVGTQFHPEFKSKPWSPSPIYSDFLKACIKNKNKK